MIAAIWFCAGAVAGILATVIAGLVVINLPPPERERAPISYGAICAGSTLDTSLRRSDPFADGIWPRH
jgi:hypothetical protein